MTPCISFNREPISHEKNCTFVESHDIVHCDKLSCFMTCWESINTIVTNATMNLFVNSLDRVRQVGRSIELPVACNSACNKICSLISLLHFVHKLWWVVILECGSENIYMCSETGGTNLSVSTAPGQRFISRFSFVQQYSAPEDKSGIRPSYLGHGQLLATITVNRRSRSEISYLCNETFSNTRVLPWILISPCSQIKKNLPTPSRSCVSITLWKSRAVLTRWLSQRNVVMELCIWSVDVLWMSRKISWAIT